MNPDEQCSADGGSRTALRGGLIGKWKRHKDDVPELIVGHSKRRRGVLDWWAVWVDRCHVPHYTSGVIKTFADKRTKELYDSGKSKRFPPGIWARALRKLEYLDLATSVTDLMVPPSNRLHKLGRDRAGQFSISVNDQWRVCFRFEDGDAYDVEITDYH